MFAEAEFVGDFAVAESVGDEGDYLLFARSQELHAQGVDHPEGRHLRDHFNQILQLLTIRPHLAMVHALYALAEQAERILGKSEQPFWRRSGRRWPRGLGRRNPARESLPPRGAPNAICEAWSYRAARFWDDRYSRLRPAHSRRRWR